MRVSIPWLKSFVNINVNNSELAEMLSMLGLETEPPFEPIFKGVVVAKVLETNQHPNADRLTLCKVSDGKEVFQVVCGATNVATGQTVPFAKAGASLGNGINITKTKIRGIQSEGMICSEQELGLSNHAEGIMVLHDHVHLGKNFKEYFLEHLGFLETNITPNRPDCMSHVGIAREIAAKTDQKLKYKHATPKKFVKNDVSDLVNIAIANKDYCPRYIAGIVQNIKVGPSPEWMVKQLESAGQRSINNIVDISNYILLEMGHPTHIFDFDKIGSNTIGIRPSKKGESIRTLDNVERQLSGELVITNGKESIALAGIMGGLESSVTQSTKNVLIESAYFDPITIRKGSKSLNLSTEASKRFERGADPQGAERAYWQVIELLIKTAGGEWVKGIVDEYPKKIIPKEIILTREKIDILSGCQLTDSFVIKTLKSLDIKVSKQNPGQWKCIPPSFRPDLEREVDLIEELCRMYGYDQIHSRFYYSGIYDLAETDPEDPVREVVHFLSDIGLKQCYTNSLTDGHIAQIHKANAVELINPLNINMSHLRTSIYSGLLEVLNFNIHNNNKSLQLFEVGKKYFKDQIQQEKLVFASVFSGNRIERNVHLKPENHSLYSIKGILNAVFDFVNKEHITFQTSENPWFSKGLDIFSENNYLGSCGQFDQNILQFLDIDANQVYGFELEAEKLIETRRANRCFIKIVNYPLVERDINLVFDAEIDSGMIIDEILKLKKEIIKSIKPVNIFKDDVLGSGKKSVTYNLTFQSIVKTLEESEISSVMSDITAVVSLKFGAKLREQ